MKIAAVMALASLAACVQPQAPDTPLVGTLSYTCTGGAILPVTYTTDPNGNTAVVIAAFGTNYNLIEEASTGGGAFRGHRMAPISSGWSAAMSARCCRMTG